MTGWYWLSFSEPRPPQGRGFLGVAIVAATSFPLAIETARFLSINPGGEVRGHLLMPDQAIPPDKLNRLIGREELEAWDFAEHIVT